MGLPYQHIYCSKDKDLLHHTRAQMVQYALKHSMRQAADVFGASRNTLTLWVPRYLGAPGAPLVDRRPPTRARHPQQMDIETEMRIIRIVTLRLSRGQPINISRLVREEKIPYSVNAVIRCLKRHGMYTVKKRRGRIVKKDLREFCRNLPPGLHLQIDIKYLTDIQTLKNSIMHKEIPLYQITARDRGTGLLWFCYTYEKSTTNTTLFLEYLLPHLQGYLGPDMPICVQTDNGKEFTTWFDSDKETLFEQRLTHENIPHRKIPPGACTHQSHVEASHRLIEDELYADMWHPTRESFLGQARVYQKWFNLKRYNTYQGGTPVELFRKRMPGCDPRGAAELVPIIVDTLLTRERLATWRSWQDGVP